MKRVLRFAVPAGTVAAAATFGAYWMARGQPGMDIAEARTTATLVLVAMGLWILSILARPLTAAQGSLVAAMGGLVAVLFLVPATRELFTLDMPSAVVVLAAVGIAALAGAALEVGWTISGWLRRGHWSMGHRVPAYGRGMGDIRCPQCGDDEQLRGEPRGDVIDVTCGACGHQWVRDPSPACPKCGSHDVLEVPRVVWEKSRGDQMSIVGQARAYVCPHCDPEEFAAGQEGRPPKLPDDFRKGDLGR